MPERRPAGSAADNSAESTTRPLRQMARNPLLRVFASRGFTLVFIGQTVSRFGNGIYQIALGWTVYEITRSPADMGIVLTVNVVPQMLLALFGGILGDRISRRVVILSTDLASAAVTAALAYLAVAGRLTFISLAAAAAVLGAASSLFSPAYRAIVPEIVPEHEYRAANGMIQASANVAQVAGPGIAGIIYAVGGPAACFAADAATFVVAVIAMVFTPLASRHVQFRRTMWADLREGFAFVWRTSWLRNVIGLALTANTLCIAPFLVLLPMVVKQAGGNSAELGVAVAAEAACAAVTAVILGRREQMSRPGMKLALLAACIGAGVMIIGARPSIPVIIAGSAVVGIGFGFDVIEMSMIQLKVPQSLMSRVFSIDIVSSFAALPVGYLAAGVLARTVGTTILLTTVGALLTALSLLAASTGSVSTLTETELPGTS